MSWFKSKECIPPILSIGFMLVYVVIQYQYILHPTPQFDVISARVQDIFVMIISFWFGSSHKNDGV